MAMTKRRWMTPEEFSDEDLGSLPRSTRFTALALRMWADDGGRARLNPRSVRGAIFANDPDMTIEDLEEEMLALAEVGFLRMYTAADGREYYAIASRFHVAPDKSKGSDLPAPPVSMASGSRPDAGPIEERGESGRETERGPSRPSPDDDTMPPLFCPDHMPSGSGGEPCVRCRDARLVHEAEVRTRRHSSRRPTFTPDDEES